MTTLKGPPGVVSTPLGGSKLTGLLGSLPPKSKGSLLMSRPPTLASSSSSCSSSGPSHPIRAPIPKRRNESAKGLTELPESFAQELDTAIAVDISHNRFSTFPRCLSSLCRPALEELNLAGNALTAVPNDLCRFSSLTTLRLSLNRLGTLPAWLVCGGVSSLREITARRCSISAIDGPAPASRSNQLRVLEVDDNELVEIPPYVAERLGSLKVFSASGNRLSSLPAVFSMLPTLAELRVQKNLISGLPATMSAVLIDASFNRIASLPHEWFDESSAQIPAVSTLLLQGNSISSLPVSLFSRLASLEAFDVSENSLTSLPPIRGPKSLQAVFAGGNRIESVTLDCSTLPNLAYLDISRNCLRALPDVSQLSSLRVFYAGSNPISQPAPASLPASLRELHLSRLGLTSLPACSPRSLEFAFLSQNRIGHRSDVEGLISAAAGSLRFADLSHNLLHKLPDCVSLGTGAEVQAERFGPHAKSRKPAGIAGLHFGVSKMTGKRPAMEDIVEVHVNLLGDSTADLVMVLDGHGGDEVAKACAGTVREHLCASLGACLDTEERTAACLAEAFKSAAAVAARISVERLIGATAVIGVFATPAANSPSSSRASLMLHVANVGDTRAILRGDDGTTMRLTVDHKPFDPAEYARIVSSGGWVTAEGRVKDTLAIARALGDTTLRPCVSSEPAISSMLVPQKAEFVVFATDGVWDVVREDVASAVVHAALERDHGSASLAALALRDWAFLSGSQDNISVVVVTLPGCACRHRKKGGR